MPPPIIVWFRRDLRVADHPALVSAVGRQGPVIPLFIWSPDEEGHWVEGGASRWWLHHSLVDLNHRLHGMGSRLIVREGRAVDVLTEVIAESGAETVLWHRRYEPAAIRRDTQIKDRLKTRKILAESYNGSLLYEPWEVQTKSNQPYRVFTPFSRACLSLREPDPTLGEQASLIAPKKWPHSLTVNDLKLLPKIHWDAGLQEAWTPGCTAAEQHLQRFLPRGVGHYAIERDHPGVAGTSRLSAALHFGELSPGQIWDAVCSHFKEDPQSPKRGEPYLRQLLWREFAHHLLYHFPQTPTDPLREEFKNFPWHKSAKHLRAWQQGQTGYPIVDAGLRELWTTGWMHNRVRMIVASFLVKDLLIPWQKGAEWFWDTLVDADLANNTLGWQWTAGCGADAAPYFRIFNPVSQGEKFDTTGDYVRRWVPEIAALSDKWIHQPWNAPPMELQEAGIKLGKTYPKPIVDHDVARKEALIAFDEMRGK